MRSRPSDSLAHAAEALALRVAAEARRTGVSPWTFRRRILRGALYRARPFRERLFLRLSSFLVARAAARRTRGGGAPR